MAEILLVDDERVVRAALSGLLKSEGYAVRVAATGAAALEQIRLRRPDLVLLDIMMPDMNGFSVCQRIRSQGESLPVLFLTAKESEGDEVRGFGCGANDYIRKTAPESILLARITAALRGRVSSASAAQQNFQLLEAEIDPVGQKLRLGEREVALTIREVEILRWFAQNLGKVASQDFLLTHFWNFDTDVSTAALQMQIKRLRDKMGPFGVHLTTVHRQGYVFTR